jgi:hypothetical protein
MSPFASYTREQLRRTYSEAWRKHQERLPQTPLESLIVDVIGLHPEYQALAADPLEALAFEKAADGAAENPFLHMGLHLAVREQLAIDRPPGVRELHRALQTAGFSAHDAEHHLMQALEQTLWEAQRAGRAPDERDYLARARRLIGG